MQRILVLGPSNVRFQERGVEDTTTPNLLRDYLKKNATQIENEVITDRLFYGEQMAARAAELIEREQADVAFIQVGTNRLEDRYVVYMVRQRWPRLYKAALKFAIKLKAASGGGPEGGEGPRGLLFRLPRAVARVLIGSKEGYPMDLALKYTKETIDALARFEDRAVAIQLLPTARAKPSRAVQRRVDTFTRELREYCSRRRVDFLSRFDYCRELGDGPYPTVHGTYPPRAQREVDARAMAGYILEAAGEPAAAATV